MCTETIHYSIGEIKYLYDLGLFKLGSNVPFNTTMGTKSMFHQYEDN